MSASSSLSDLFQRLSADSTASSIPASIRPLFSRGESPLSQSMFHTALQQLGSLVSAAAVHDAVMSAVPYDGDYGASGAVAVAPPTAPRSTAASLPPTATSAPLTAARRRELLSPHKHSTVVAHDVGSSYSAGSPLRASRDESPSMYTPSGGGDGVDRGPTSPVSDVAVVHAL
jgi:hypothetical protein